MVEVKHLDTKHATDNVLLKNVDAVLLNSIRRTAMNAVPVLAIDEIDLFQNTSVLVDEFLSHRLGLIPIKTDKAYKLGDTAKLTIDKEGPCTVYSGDIKGVDPKVEVADKHIVIAKLRKGQIIKAELNAVMNTGKEHVRFQPAIIGYRNVPDIHSKDNCNACLDTVDVCPTNVLEVKANKLVLKDPLNCILCGKCRDVSKNHVEIDYKEDSFVFSIESNGQYTNGEVVQKATDVLQEKVEEFKKAVKDL